MVGWYKHDIPAWMNGTENLDADCYRVYHVVCQLIYLNEGPIARNEQGIAGRCKMHVLRLRRCLDQLVTLGKLTVNPDHTLDQPRANLELSKIGSNRVNAGLGGSAPRKSLKNKDRDEATLKENSTEKTREDQTRPDEKRITPLRVADDWPEDFGDLFWQAYPRKTEKLAAMKKLSGVRKSGVVTFDDLMAGVKRYAAARTEPQFTKHPTTWLNAGCWADETQPQLAGSSHGRRTVQDAARDLHENLLERIAAFDEPAPRGLRDGEGPDVVRLLPAGRRE